jgi:hypothetical protein
MHMRSGRAIRSEEHDTGAEVLDAVWKWGLASIVRWKYTPRRYLVNDRDLLRLSVHTARGRRHEHATVAVRAAAAR